MASRPSFVISDTLPLHGTHFFGVSLQEEMTAQQSPFRHRTYLISCSPCASLPQLN